MSVSAEASLAPDSDGPGLPGSSAPGGTGDGRGPETRPARPLVVTGGIAACAAAASGLAVLTTLTAIGWITAPHVGIGSGLGGVLRTAAMLWLVAHHVGFTVRGAGRIGLLPLGLVLLPGALLAVAGRWVVRAGAVTRLRHVGYAAVALALPYSLLAGALAVASRTAVAAPSLLQAVVASFLLALVAGGLGAARGLAPWSRLASLMPARPRSIVMGMLGSAAILAAAGAVLAGGSLAVHLPEVRAASDALAPGVGGAALLLLAQLAYAPNAIIWAVAYTLGPGFAFGAGTVVAPTGSALGAVPLFPMLAAMPAGSRPGGPAWVPVAVLAVPYLAGIFAGIITVRIAPTPMIEAAPLWGFAAGAAAGGLAGLGRGLRGRPARQRPAGRGRPVRFPGGPGSDTGDRHHGRAGRGDRELAPPPQIFPARPGRPAGRRGRGSRVGVGGPRGSGGNGFPPESGRSARIVPRGEYCPPGPARRDRRRRRPPDLPQPVGRRRAGRLVAGRLARTGPAWRADNGVTSGTLVFTGTPDYLPFCSTLISLPTELLS